MFTLIQNAEVYTPQPVGRTDLLLDGDTVVKVGSVDPRHLEGLGVEFETIDATGCLAIPGLIDPHVHLLGGSGEEGFASQTPEIFTSEIVQYGITSVVGLLGVDTTMKTLPGLLARVKALKEDGLSAWMWTGGYNIPPTSMMDTVREDIMFIEEVIGVGEVAISDLRAMDPPAYELARVASDCYIGGMLARTAGLVHFHVGDRETRLQPIRDLLDQFHVSPEWLYATHIERSEALMREAIELAERGMAVDIDTVEEDLPRWIRFYIDNGGDLERLTVSSDTGLSSPRVLLEQLRSCVLEHGFALERVLPLVTSNTAGILKLKLKGTLEAGKDADVVVMERDTLEVVHVLARGQIMVRDGAVVMTPKFLEKSKREIHLVGHQS